MVTSSRTRNSALVASANKDTPSSSKAVKQRTSRADATRKIQAIAVDPLQSAPAKSTKKKDKPEKVKVVRDSFTIPKAEYTQIAELKKRALGMGLEAKKSELIRAGLLLLSNATDASLGKALKNVPTLKTGRPGKA